MALKVRVILHAITMLGKRTNELLSTQLIGQALAQQIDAELMNPAVGGFSIDQVHIPPSTSSLILTE